MDEDLERTTIGRTDPLVWLRMLVKSAAALFLVAIVVDVLVGVIARYALHVSLPWNEEVARLFLVWLSFLGAAAAAAGRVAIRVDSVIGHFQPGRTRLILEGIVATLSIVALVLFIYASRDLFGPSSSSTEPGSGISALWFELALPVSAVLAIVFIAFDLFRIVTRGEIPQSPGPGEDQQIQDL